MVSDLMNKGCADDGEPSIAPESIPTGRSSSVSPLSNPMCSEMSVPVLATHCLRASLNGAILDTLRASARPGEASLPEPGEPGEPQAKDVTSSSEVWDILQTIRSNEREQRLASLLFHCGLKPREIVRFCPQEW